VVVGYGRWGRCCHCQLIGSTPGLELYGVVSRDPEKRQQAASAHGCSTFAEFHEVLHDDKVDLVVLATPNSTHAELAVRALEHGKHVLTDKVMCLNIGECDRMISAAERNNRLLTVFQNRRFDGDFTTVRSLIDAGELGDVRWIEMAWQGFGAWRGWRGRSDMGGGKIYDLGVHMVDQLLVLFPEDVDSVYCRTHYDFPDCEVESEGLIVVTFEGGRTGVVDVSSLAAVKKPRFYVRGMKGTFVKTGLDPQEKAMMEGDIDAAREPEEHYGTLKTADSERPVPTQAGRWRAFFENLGEALAGRAEPVVTLAQARRVIAVLDAAKRSALTKEVVRV
jgi:scyllo-inositol 2-dehydrogenase (NADP+)